MPVPGPWAGRHARRAAMRGIGEESLGADKAHPKASEIFPTLPTGLMPTGWRPPGSGRSVA